MENSTRRVLFVLGALLIFLSCAMIPRGRHNVHKHDVLYNRTKALSLVEYASAVRISELWLLGFFSSKARNIHWCLKRKFMVAFIYD